MSGRLTSAITARFDPDAAPPGVGEVTDVMTLTLATRLDGVRLISATGYGLRAQLTAVFGPQGPCDRIQLLGITPPGHADLVLTSAGYWGSTCRYTGPDQPFYAYFERSDPNAETDTLVVGMPSDNISCYFSWPIPDVLFDPEIAEDEATPLTYLKLLSLEDLNGESDAETGGVRLSMRLYLGDVVVRELTYENAPHFTGSSSSVRCHRHDDGATPPPENGLFAVTAAELAEAAPKDEYHRTIAGIYDLTWKIYKGSGRFNYQLHCDSSAVGDPYQDTRDAGIGGGFGTFETTDLVVAKVHIEPEPYPWAFKAKEISTWHETYQTCDYDGHLRGAAALYFNRRWVGKTKDEKRVVVSWGDPYTAFEKNIFVNGVLIHTADAKVVAAALKSEPASEFREAHEAIYYLMRYRYYDPVSHTYLDVDQIILKRYPIVKAGAVQSLGTALMPREQIEDPRMGHLLYHSFSPDVSMIGIFAAPMLNLDITESLNGELWSIPVGSAETQWLGDWTAENAPTPFADAIDVTYVADSDYLAGPPKPTIHDTYHSLEFTEQTLHYQYAIELVIGAAWSGNTWAEISSEVELTCDRYFRVRREHENTCFGDQYHDIPFECGQLPTTGFIVTETAVLYNQGEGNIDQTVNSNWTLSVDGVLVSHGNHISDHRTSTETTGRADRVERWNHGAPAPECPDAFHSEGLYTSVDHYTSEAVETVSADEDLHVELHRGLKVESLPYFTQGKLIANLGYITRHIPDEAFDWEEVERDPSQVLKMERIGEAPTDLLYIDDHGLEDPMSDSNDWRWDLPRMVDSEQAARDELWRGMRNNFLLMSGDVIINSQYDPPRYSSATSLFGKQCLESDGRFLSTLSVRRALQGSPVNIPSISRTAIYDATSGARDIVTDLEGVTPDRFSLQSPVVCLDHWSTTDKRPEGGSCGSGTPGHAELIAAHNAERSAAGLGLGDLTENTLLTSAIERHLVWLLAQDFEYPIQHEGEDGSLPIDRGIAEGYIGIISTLVLENLAWGQRTVEEVMREWMDSPGHRQNILDPRPDEIGVSIIELADEPGRYIWGALFGHRTDT